jgi:hypothetical protein
VSVSPARAINRWPYISLSKSIERIVSSSYIYISGKYLIYYKKVIIYLIYHTFCWSLSHIPLIFYLLVFYIEWSSVDRHKGFKHILHIRYRCLLGYLLLPIRQLIRSLLSDSIECAVLCIKGLGHLYPTSDLVVSTCLIVKILWVSPWFTTTTCNH